MFELPESSAFVVFDLEWTAWLGSLERNWKRPGESRELIQIGAVKLATATLFEIDSFECLVRPEKNPILSDYITNLTGITNSKMISEGLQFKSSISKFTEFAGVEFCFCNGGDRSVLIENLTFNQLASPDFIERCINIRPALSDFLKLPSKDVISGNLPFLLQLPGEFRIHDALSDARAIAAAIRRMASGETGVPNA